jgi:hypothetical protein
MSNILGPNFVSVHRTYYNYGELLYEVFVNA